MIKIISTLDRFILRITNIASTFLLAMVFITFLIVSSSTVKFLVIANRVPTKNAAQMDTVIIAAK